MRKLLVFAAFAALAVAVAACTGDDDDDDDAASPSPSPSPSPTAAGPYDITMGATDWPHANGGARILQGSTVVYCTSGTLGVSGQVWSITQANIVTNNAVAYTVEIWGDANATAGYQPADHEYNFTRPANTTTDSNFTFDHDTEPNMNTISWTTGTCP